jgi:hypothetical protein
MRAVEFLIEFELPKNKWELIVSNDDKQELGTDLVSLVAQAYSNTPQGSFVNSIKDVIPSDWNVIDWDKDPDVDSCVFYRRNRQGENWNGYKIQGLGHDGTRTSKDKAINKIQELLSRPGVWIESSDAMRHVLKKLNVPAVTDEKLLQTLFNDPNLKMIDDDTYVRVLSDGTKVTETVFGNPKVRATEFTEEVLDEMPLPADWDPQQMKQGATTFKSRLAYALERAKKLGTGSSRVATVIEYQGRPTVLKIAKNQKGLAQNSVEADILSDGYASQLGVLIPIIDYDEQNREPTWIHTEMATKANEKQLCNLLKVPSLSFLVNFAWSITGKKRFMGLPDGYITQLRNKYNMSEDDIEVATDYANTLADLHSSFDVELGDFSRAANWGLYQSKPVIVDVGFNSNVLNQYYK